MKQSHRGGTERGRKEKRERIPGGGGGGRSKDGEGKREGGRREGEEGWKGEVEREGEERGVGRRVLEEMLGKKRTVGHTLGRAQAPGGGVIFKCINNSASILVVTENTLLRGSERLTRNILI